MPKVHKNKTHTSFCIIVSQAGSILAIPSTWLDTKLQKFTNLIPSYVCNSQYIVSKIQTLASIPPSARLFTANVEAMYPNIDPKEGLPTVRNFIETYSTNLALKMRLN